MRFLWDFLGRRHCFRHPAFWLATSEKLTCETQSEVFCEFGFQKWWNYWLSFVAEMSAKAVKHRYSPQAIMHHSLHSILNLFHSVCKYLDVVPPNSEQSPLVAGWQVIGWCRLLGSLCRIQTPSASVLMVHGSTMQHSYSPLRHWLQGNLQSLLRNIIP